MSSSEPEDDTARAALQSKSRQAAQNRVIPHSDGPAMMAESLENAVVKDGGGSVNTVVEINHQKSKHCVADSPALPGAVPSKQGPESQVSGPTAKDSRRGLSFVQLIGSALAACIGVQSSKNRKRDFNEGRVGAFVATGIIFTVLFIATVLTMVSFVLGSRT
ncbi:MAG: DUF2970 domain-containing protein [Pseudomonadota bacterium]